MKVLDIKPATPEVKVLALSGTPVSTSPMNAYSLLRMLAPELLPSEARFMQHFCVTQMNRVGGRMVSQIVNYRNLRDLKRLVELVSIRRLAEETSGMPDDIMIERPVIMTPEQRGVYAEVEEQTIAEIKGEPPSTLHFPTVKLVRLRQVLNHPRLLGQSGDSGKWLECDILVDEVLSNPEAKLVIWTEWKEAASTLAERYREYKAVSLTGDTPKNVVLEMESTFDTNDCRIIVSTPFKGGTGINWLARARTAIWIERVWSLVTYRQALKRLARRTKQVLSTRLDVIKASPARQIFLHATGTVDDLVRRTLTANSNLAEAVTTPDDVLFRLNRDDVLRFLEKHG